MIMGFKIVKMKNPVTTRLLKEGKTFYRIKSSSGEYVEDFKTLAEAKKYVKQYLNFNNHL